MPERQERANAQEKSAQGAREATRETLPPAQDQDESLKVHGDKLEQKKR